MASRAHEELEVRRHGATGLIGLPRTVRPVTWCACAALLGFLLNYAALPVFGSTVLVFGSLLGVLAAVAFGPLYGAGVTAVAMLQTWIAWGHPYGVIVFALESWAIGWLVHRRGYSLLRAAVLYWITIGTPLSAVLILLLFQPPFPTNFAVFLKYPANGMIVVAFAQLIVHSRWFWRITGTPLPDAFRRETMRTHLLRRLVVVSVWPALVFGLAVGVMFNFQARQNVQRELATSAHEVAGTVNAYLVRHEQILESVASALEGSDPTPAELSRLLDDLRRRTPGFLTMLVADQRGDIIANSPRLAPGVLTNVADRNYFRHPVVSGPAYVSPVFRGRGFGQEMIVAVSVAYLDARGTRCVLEGSLDLRLMNAEIARAPNLSWREVMVFDTERQTVFASHEGPARRFITQFQDLPRARGTEVVEDDTTVNAAGRLVRKYGVWQTVPGYGWQVYLREDAWYSVSTIARFYLAGAGALGGILLIGWLISRQTAQHLSRPFVQLLNRTGSGKPGDTVVPFAPDEDVPDEWRQLADDLTRAASALAEANEQLTRAVAERDQTAGQLRALTNELEKRVAERTAELDHARAVAERASQAKSDFLATVSHELRTPLNVALGHIFLLLHQRQEPLPDAAAERVRKIKASADHLLSVINDILDLAKLEAGRTLLEPQLVSPQRLCEECGDFFREEFMRARLEFKLEVCTSDLVLRADPRRLRQIMLNLLSNAVKFTPEGGTVGLHVAVDEVGRRIAFTVWDTGIGISAEQQERLFRPFEQADQSLSRKFSGTGLGLSIVKRLTDLHGGVVSLRSEPGRGSRFTVTLPLLTAAESALGSSHDAFRPADPAR
jgi:signal transduction histidine kinase/GNAT superfamily N-acetyltransferase